MKKARGLSTDCIHGGDLKDGRGSPHMPLYDTTTFAFDSTADLLDVVEGRKAGGLYTRYGLNPTIQALEAKLALLEGAQSALAFGSGMAAEAALFLAHGREGVVCVGNAYGGTLDLLEKQLPQLGIPTAVLLSSEEDRLRTFLDGSKRLVFFETPTNPALEIIDIQRLASLAHDRGALVAVDNTFASPVNQNPLALGADIVVHSATKYLGGHSDLTAGALMGSEECLAPIRPWRSNLGQTIAPDVAQLLMRSLYTLVVRVARHNENAWAVVQALRDHRRVSRVFYPGLKDSPGHEIAQRQMSGFGGMVTFEVRGSGADATRVVDRLKLIKIAPSLGGVESLVTQPMTTTHHGLSEAERARRGISDSMVRLSIGLEDAVDLVADLVQALA